MRKLLTLLSRLSVRSGCWPVLLPDVQHRWQQKGKVLLVFVPPLNKQKLSRFMFMFLPRERSSSLFRGSLRFFFIVSVCFGCFFYLCYGFFCFKPNTDKKCSALTILPDDVVFTFTSGGFGGAARRRRRLPGCRSFVPAVRKQAEADPLLLTVPLQLMCFICGFDLFFHFLCGGC